MGDELDGNPDAAAIREFHAAARKRQMWIMFVAAAVLIAFGAVMLVLMVVLEPTVATSHDAAYRGRGAAGEVKLGLYGGAAIVIGCIMAWNGWRIRKGARYG